MAIPQNLREPVERFRLRINVSIEKVYDDGHNHFTNSGEHLSISEQMEIGVTSFLDIAGVLGRFNELGRELRTEHA